MWTSNYEAGVVRAKMMFERWWKVRNGHAKRSEPRVRRGSGDEVIDSEWAIESESLPSPSGDAGKHDIRTPQKEPGRQREKRFQYKYKKKVRIHMRMRQVVSVHVRIRMSNVLSGENKPNKNSEAGDGLRDARELKR
jgi:hypothetical protein